MTNDILRIARRMIPLALAVAAPAAAQQVDVGFPPPRSPFRDLEHRHELTLFVGQFNAGKDPAGVAPRSGPMIGVRYEIGVGGPAQLLARGGYVKSERRALDPDEPAASRDLGVHDWPLYFADFGISMNLTGQRSYRRLVPQVNLGIGFVSDGGKSVEGDPFRFGTAFSLVYGAGIRYVPGGRYQLRLGADSYLYRIRYPGAYFLATGSEPPVLPGNQSQSFWKNNLALTVGLSYLF